MTLFNIKNSIASLLTVLALCFAGCKKFTEKPYDNRIELKFTEHYQQILTDAYPARHEMFTDILTDDYDFHNNLGQAAMVAYFLPMYLWKDDYPDNYFTGPDLAYREFYAKIYRANIVINGVMGSEKGSPELKSAVLGEALVLRAYCHFMLVNLFGQHYNPATAASDLGVPVVTEVNEDNVKHYARNTVQEVYAQIEKDAAEGIAQLQKGGDNVSKNPYHFSLTSANAFMSRVKLYKGEWAASIKFADAVIADKGRIVRDLATDLTLIKQNGIQIFTAKYMDPTTHPSILLDYYSTDISFLAPTGFAACGFYPADNITPVFTSADLRSKLLYPVGTVIDKRVMVTKYEVQPNNPDGSFRASYLSMEEVLLNRAEAVLRSGGTVQDALTDLEVLRKARYSPYTALSATGLTPADLLTTVLLERRKEFINEGLRWFDVKRLGLKVDHSLSRGQAPETLQANDLRKVLQIPRKEREGNPNIQLNPR